MAGLVAPLANLLPVIDTSLQALSEPSMTCNGARFLAAAGGAKLTMAGQTYPHGFQLLDDFDNFDNHCTDSWRWHIGPSFRTFTATVGLDESRSTAASLAFIGVNGKPMPFTADGQPLTQLVLYAGEPTNIAIELTGIVNFIISSTNNAGGTIDFANDTLSP